MPNLLFKSLLGRRSQANRTPSRESPIEHVSERGASSRTSAALELQRDRWSFSHLSKCSTNDLAAMQRVCIEAITALRRIEHS
ncbi:TPA: hypothetical protein QDB24_002853 [Burkholderia vietnamiensis]|uniref:hypothetical protein n=1 Tax=Burkholderia vietnamiensis TaxID=60552 RepID=UPI001B963E5D|nr:hypothetical protein [Burkholderia vietnamiensis]MBR7909115.1 hypothetical protein [Burkholderia vietnamiensis]HDR9274779.1 hypothetical protein [Burkholderia vietnamiensis]